jgi:hypothetical protein
MGDLKPEAFLGVVLAGLLCWAIIIAGVLFLVEHCGG